MRADTTRALAVRTQRLDAAVAFGAGAPPASAAHDRLTSGQSLTRGQSITSPSGRFRFTLQSDGNAVVYDSTRALWATNTVGRGAKFTMQSDGNIVLYDAANHAIWASNTVGRGASVLVMQDDNNLVAYQNGQTAFWSSRAAGNYSAVSTIVSGAPPASKAKDRLAANQSLLPNQSITSPSGRYRFTLQSDGNAVVYDGPHALWATGTNGKAITQCVMQSDGNLVLYDAQHRAYWASNTAGKGSSVIVIQDDNNLVIYQGTTTPTWSSRGASQKGPFDDIGQFINSAVAAAGKSIGDGLATIAGGLHDIQNAIAKIPAIGGALATLYDLASAPFTTLTYVANSVAHGENLGQALKANLDRLGKELDDVLPWIASIISIFPVFGPLVSSIIMTAAALAEGQPIEEVLIEAALAAIPGMAVIAHFAGPIIEFGIRLAKAIATHALDFGTIITDGLKAIAEIVEINIPDFIVEALKCGINFAAMLARGMKVADALLQEAIQLLQKYGPQLLGTAYHALGLDTLVKVIGDEAASLADKLAAQVKIAGGLTSINFPGFPGPLNDIMRKIFGSAVSLGSAAHIQLSIAPKVEGIANDLIAKGQKLVSDAASQAVEAAKAAVSPDHLVAVAKDLAASEARKLVPPECLKGWDLAIGTLQNTVNPFQLLTLRSTLDDNGKKGFDMASAFHVGRVAIQPPPPPPPPSPVFAPARGTGFGPNLTGMTLTGMGSFGPISWPPGVLAAHAPSVASSNAGFFITAGMGALPPAAKTSIMGTVAASPTAQVGAAAAVVQVATARAADPTSASVVKVSWWQKLLLLLHRHPAQTAVSVHANLATA